jgi:ARTD15 N-terminal domain
VVGVSPKEWKVFDLLLKMELAVLRERRRLFKEITCRDYLARKAPSVGAPAGSAAVDDGHLSKGTQHAFNIGGNPPFREIDIFFCRQRRKVYIRFMALDLAKRGISSLGSHEAMPFLDLMARDPHAADLLVSMASAAAKCSDQTRRKLLLPTVPQQFCKPLKRDIDVLARTLDKLPPIAQLVPFRNISKFIAEVDKRLPATLHWIVESFQGHLELLEANLMHSDWHIFLLKPSTAEAKRGFGDRKRKAGGSLFAFHGSPFYNWHSILCSRLKNASGTPLQVRSMDYGEGIYLTSCLEIAYWYADEHPVGAWNNSLFGSVSCLALCEIVPGSHVRSEGPIFVVKDEKSVEILCLIVIPQGSELAHLKYAIASDMVAAVKGTVQYRKMMRGI